VSRAHSKAYNLLADMTLDEFRAQHPEVTSPEVLEAMYDDRLTAFVEDDDEEADNACSMCGGELTLLGTLGTRVHYRCRHCGFDGSVS
jgi:hypothetical protein